MRIRLFHLLLIAVLSAGPAAGQDPAGRRDARPRVALVLSGGGARGFAHIGVLKVLDELRVPVDLVVGTSMGAVVGGLHATGMPYAMLESRFLEQDWVTVFRDRPDRRSIRLRQKRDDRELTLPFEVGLSDEGPRLPSSIIAGAHLTSLLEVHTWAATGTSDFDALPIPFRAVATDVQTGEAIVLGRGRLATAIRASMAVPAVFSPVVIDGRMLVDGGVVENLPLRVARELGADVSIVVDLSTGLGDLDESESILSISQRVLTIFMARNAEAQLRTLGEADVLIVPDLRGFSTADFGRLEEGIRKGEAAARSVSDRLRTLSVTDAEYRAIVEARGAVWQTVPIFVPDFVRVDTTTTALAPAVILSATRLRPHEAILVPDLADEAVHIMGYGGFQRVAIDLIDDDDEHGVVIRPEDKPWGPGLLRAGLTLTDRQRGDAAWELLVNYAHVRFSPGGAQVRANVRLGSVQGGGVEFYQPIDAAERAFATFEAGAIRRDVLLPTDTAGATNVEFADLVLRVGAGLRLGTWGELRGGLTRGILRVERPAQPGGGTVERIDAAGFYAELEIDHLDRIGFPRNGELLIVEARAGRKFLGGEQSFNRVGADALAFRSRGQHTLGVGAMMGTALGDVLPTTQRFSLGGLFRLTGMQPSALQGSYAGLGRVLYRYRLNRADTGVHLGGSVEAGGAWPTLDAIHFRDVRLSASLFIGVDTPIGPLHLAYGFTRGIEPGWILRFGPVL